MDQYKLCPSCMNFTESSEPVLFCILCGEKVINACPACNAPIIYPTARYCHACGTGLGQAYMPAQATDHPSHD